MTKVLMIKEKVKALYEAHELWINRILRFFLVFVSMLVLWINIGSNSLMKNPLIILLASAIAAFIPLMYGIIIVLVAVLLHLYSISVELAGVGAILFLIMYFLYFRFTRKDALVIVILPILFFLKIPYVVPMVIGLSSGPISLISIIFGTMIYFLMDYASVLGDGSVGMVLGAIFKNEIYLLNFLCMVLIFIIVYTIRRRSINHSHGIAVLAAGVLNVIVMMAGYVVLGNIKIVPVLIMIAGVAVSIGIAFVLHYAILSLNYSQTEFIQFEDDDYYYYVKAVPKVKVTAQEVSVKRINVQKPKRK